MRNFLRIFVWDNYYRDDIKTRVIKIKSGKSTFN